MRDTGGSRRLFKDATWLASSSLVTAAFGMISWALTARLIPPEQLGVMAAVLAAITTPAGVTSNTVGATYTSLLPAANEPAALYRYGQRSVVIAGVVGGVLGAVATVSAIDGLKGSVAVFALVVIGTVMMAFNQVQGSTLMAIGRAGWILPSTISVNVTRILLLFAFAVTFKWHSYELSAVLSAGLTAVVVARLMRPLINEKNSSGRLDEVQAVCEFRRFTKRVIVIVLLSYAVNNFTPFLVTAFGGAAQGALFALVLSVAQTLDLVSAAMGTSLVVQAASGPESEIAMGRAVFLRALGITIAGAVVLTASISPLLQFLNPMYGGMNAVAVTAVLCAAPAARTFFMTWWALERARRSLRPTLVVSTFGAITSLTLVPLLSSHYGALGGAIGFTAAYAVLSAGALLYVLRGRRRTIARV